MLLGGDGIRQLGSNDEEVSRIMEMTGSQAMLGERPREILGGRERLGREKSGEVTSWMLGG